MSVRLVSQEELPGPLTGYRLIERLGRGGFGEVWKVEAPGGLMKAAKFVFGDLEAMDEDSRPAEQELKALRRVREIRHPYILSLERYDQIDGQLIIVMELADRNLWDRFRECRGLGMTGIPRDELLGYLEEAAEALDLMNGQYQIQHLDVKPQNLFLVHNHLKVGDFGLAKLLEGIRATVTGGVTPVYAAPETFEGWVSRFSDQYSLAIVFQELLTGTRPFNGSNTRQLLMQHISGTPDMAALPPGDQEVIARALSKKPDDRWTSCGEMVRGLKLSGLPSPTATPQVGVFRRDFGPADAADSGIATRLAPGGVGRFGPDPAAQTKAQTPPPVGLPPLVKPASSHSLGSGTPTPNPGFGPRLVTPGAAPVTPGMTLNRPVIFQTGRMGSLGIAPPERNGDGPLFPTLVVGVGQTGRRVIEQFKHLIAERYGHPDRVPSVRFLYIDTDAEAIPTSPPTTPSGLAPREAVLARLNRPGHYLQRESLPPVDAWMPPGSLYKLARSPESAGGVRAFGRLALFDNYRLVAQRIRQEIEPFLTDVPLVEAAKNTGLGVRTNRPRAYVVAGLGGGTGGGMFIDLAFLLRHELRQVGYMRPEVVGVFFVPPANATTARGSGLGNTFAALAELHHFQSARVRYETTFDRSEAPVVDSEPPFARSVVLTLPKSLAPQGPFAVVRLAARALFQEALTPAGRVIDEVREAHRKASPPTAPVCQTLNLYRLSWPRPETLAAATRRFAQRQIQRWTAKDATQLREPITAWLARQWGERKLGFESMVLELNEAVRKSLGEDPDRAFDSIADGLRGPARARTDTAAACAVFDQLLKLVGKPDAESDPTSWSLYAPLAARYEQMARDVEGQVAVMAATFLDVPQFRLPGAEEAIRQIGDRLKRQVDTLEPLRAELDRDVRAAYARMFQAIGVLNAATGLGVIVGRKAAAAAEIAELARVYPRKRIQLTVLELCLAIYRKLLENTPEYLREISFCRGSLAEMHAVLAKDAPQNPSPSDGQLILPDGCKDLDAAADQFLAGLAPEDLVAFEQQFQKTVGKKFKGLGSVCLKPAEKGPAFRAMLMERSRAFLDERLDHSDPAAVFFRCRTNEDAAAALVVEAFGQSAPAPAPADGEKPFEIGVLGVPVGEAGDRFRALVARVLPDAELTPAPLPEDICFYRECPQLDLTSLPQLGEHAREAYQAAAAADHPPHARVDIPWQIPGTP